MRKLLALLVLLSACAPRSFKGRELSPFAVYYGFEEFRLLSSYKMVIIQPWAYTAPDVKRLQENGTLVLGYLSVGEDDELRRGNGKGPGGYAPWYIDEYTGKELSKPQSDGQPDMNPAWKSYYVDSSDPHWQKHVRKKAKIMKRELGVDGIFVDTALVPENVFTDAREEKMKKGIQDVIRHLKKTIGGGYILVNNGWREYDSWKDRIDGVMIETDDVKDIAKIKQDIDARAGNDPKDVFALIYMDKTDSETVSTACEQLIRMNIQPVLYSNDAGGQNLTSLPLSNCL